MSIANNPRHYYDNSYIKKMTQRDYLDYCEKIESAVMILISNFLS